MRNHQRITGKRKDFPRREQTLLDTYYKYKGWNNDGIPTKKNYWN